MQIRPLFPATCIAMAACLYPVVNAGEATPDALTNVDVASKDAGTPVTSLATARSQAACLHDAMHATLQITHDRFYREDEGLPIPAATLKEVFAEVRKKQNITLRWLVVEGQAMNVDHEAKTEFEKSAVKALKSGKLVHEQITAGTYRRVGPIKLGNHCLKCHMPDRRSLQDRKAGLMISIPLAPQVIATPKK